MRELINHMWKLLTIFILLFVNIPYINNTISLWIDPKLNEGLERVAQSPNSVNMQCLYVDTAIPYVDASLIKSGENPIRQKPFKDKFTFIATGNPGFDTIVRIIKDKNARISIKDPNFILNHQESDKGDISNLYTTERVIYFCKLREGTSLEVNKNYSDKEFRSSFDNIKAVATEQDLIQWVKEYRSRVVGLWQVVVLILLFVLLIREDLLKFMKNMQKKWSAMLCRNITMK